MQPHPDDLEPYVTPDRMHGRAVLRSPPGPAKPNMFLPDPDPARDDPAGYIEPDLALRKSAALAEAQRARRALEEATPA